MALPEGRTWPPMHTYQAPPCNHCGGTRWKKISVPIFRLEECLKCHANRTTTDVAVGPDQAPVSVVYLVVESWGAAFFGVIGVFSSEAGAEQEAARRRDPHRPDIRFLVQRFAVLGDSTA